MIVMLVGYLGGVVTVLALGVAVSAYRSDPDG